MYSLHQQVQHFNEHLRTQRTSASGSIAGCRQCNVPAVRPCQRISVQRQCFTTGSREITNSSSCTDTPSTQISASDLQIDVWRLSDDGLGKPNHIQSQGCVERSTPDAQASDVNALLQMRGDCGPYSSRTFAAAVQLGCANQKPKPSSSKSSSTCPDSVDQQEVPGCESKVATQTSQLVQTSSVQNNIHPESELSQSQQPDKPEPGGPFNVSTPFKLYALALLAATYVHQAANSMAIPVMLPMIQDTLKLPDIEGAFLTSGYWYLYAMALIPMGIIADKVRRPTLLGLGVAAWSSLSLYASNASSFAELMLARVGGAAAQSTQNVVCFSIIPELFPKRKSTALAFYNTAIYLGRGLIYMVANAARQKLTVVEAAAGALTAALPTATSSPEAIDAAAKQLILRDASGNVLVPLEKLDLHLAQLMYVVGDMAAIRINDDPDYVDDVITDQASPALPLMDLADVAPGVAEVANHHASEVWRTVLHQLFVPGVIISGLLLFTIPDTRDGQTQANKTTQPANQTQPSQSTQSQTVKTSSQLPSDSAAIAASNVSQTTTANANSVQTDADKNEKQSGSLEKITQLFTNAPFVTVTAAAAVNDMASYALTAWQSTFYERIYHMEVSQYAPTMAWLLPVGGIVGGVGGGLLADRFKQQGKGWVVTAATTMMAAPLFWASLTAESPDQSFLYLGLGFALSETWRAPAAVLARSVVPAGSVSTAVSIYLSLRNILGGFGPILIAHMSKGWGLQNALLLVPPMYILSAVLFGQAEAYALQQQKQAENSSDAAAAGAGASSGSGEAGAAQAGSKEGALVAAVAVAAALSTGTDGGGGTSSDGETLQAVTVGRSQSYNTRT